MHIETSYMDCGYYPESMVLYYATVEIKSY